MEMRFECQPVELERRMKKGTRPLAPARTWEAMTDSRVDRSPGRVLTVLALFVLAGACTSQRTADPDPAPAAPLVPPEAEPPAVDVEPAAKVLESFLEARWKFDREAALEFVTASDRDNAPPSLRPFPKPGNARPDRAIDDTDWCEWEVIDVSAVDDSLVQARVDVTMPTFRTVNGWSLQNSMRTIALATQPGGAQVLAKTSPAEILVPARHVIRMNYRVVRERDVWRVHMGWSRRDPDDARFASQHLVFDRWTSNAEAEGSERYLVETQEHRDRRRSRVSKEQRALSSAIATAESEMHGRRFDEALAAYQKIVLDEGAPSFVLDRPERIEELRALWEAKLEAASIVTKLGSVREVGDGRHAVDVTLENGGDVTLKSVRARVDTGEASIAPSIHCDDLEPGGRCTTTAEFRWREGGVPKLGEVWLTKITFDDEKLNERFAMPREIQFQRSLYEFKSGGMREQIHDLASDVRSSVDECPGWPSDLVSARITVDRSGAVDSVRLRPSVEDESFEKCVRERVHELRYFERPTRWRAEIQLIPPGYWKRLAADALRP